MDLQKDFRELNDVVEDEYECSLCGAIVVNRVIHEKFHTDMDELKDKVVEHYHGSFGYEGSPYFI